MPKVKNQTDKSDLEVLNQCIIPLHGGNSIDRISKLEILNQQTRSHG